MLTPTKILITRLSAIGDCIQTIPLAVDAKKLWPEAHITWLVDCAAEQLLASHPCVDRVVRIEKKWMQRPSNWFDYRHQLKAEKFDLVLDPQGLTKSSMLGWLSGARSRIGFNYAQAREIAPLLATRRVRKTMLHRIDCYRQLLTPWRETEPNAGEFRMPMYEAAASSVRQKLHELGLKVPHEHETQSARDWVAINPGAGWSTRLWPLESFSELTRQLHERLGQRSVVFWAGETERLMASVIVEQSQGAAVLAPDTTLPELLESVRMAPMLITGDTGPLHVAISVGTPTIGLHGPTIGEQTGGYTNPHISIQSPKTDFSGKKIRSGENLMMQAISPDEVLVACRQLLTRLDSSKAAAA